MKKTEKLMIVRIVCRRGTEYEVYYEPRRLTDKEKENLLSHGWSVRQYNIIGNAISAEIQKHQKAADQMDRASASLSGASSLSFAYGIGAGYRQAMIKKIEQARSGISNLMA
ncbi:MAG: hypothetical protein M0Z43_13615 [Acidithiobacillus sp.]|nr:hypothetical protein [Acidithiobacillus sp.]